MNPSEQDKQNQPEEKIPDSPPDSSSASGAAPATEKSSGDDVPEVKQGAEPPVTPPQAGGAAVPLQAAEPGSVPEATAATTEPQKKEESVEDAAGSSQPSSGDAAEAGPDPAPPGRSGTELGGDPRKILQELEKEYNSEKVEMSGPPSSAPAVSPSAPPPVQSLREDSSSEELITEAMRELDALIKKIKASH